MYIYSLLFINLLTYLLTYLGICYVGFFIIFRSYIVDKNCQLCNCKKKRIRNHMVNTEKMDTTKLRPA